MTCQRVLEVEKAEVCNSLPALDQHDVLGMIIAKHRDRAKSVIVDGLEHFPPGLPVIPDVDLSANRRTVPIGEQAQLIEPLLEAVRPEPLHWRVLMQMDQYIRCERV